MAWRLRVPGSFLILKDSLLQSFCLWDRIPAKVSLNFHLSLLVMRNADRQSTCRSFKPFLPLSNKRIRCLCHKRSSLPLFRKLRKFGNDYSRQCPTLSVRNLNLIKHLVLLFNLQHFQKLILLITKNLLSCLIHHHARQ